HADFDAAEAHLRGKNLPPEIIRRHREAVAAYDREMQTLQGNLDNVAGIAEKTPQNIQKLQGAVDQALEHLQPLQTQGRHAPFDPEQLPFSIPKGEVRPPLETGEALKKLAPPGKTGGVLRASGRPGAPGPDYLTATEDIQITPEIKALALELQHHPVKAYNWVVNNIRFVPSHGSIQGSQMTLETRSGNASDTASFLAALLRASGIATRFRYGAVRIPVEKAMNWVGGAKTPEAAVQLLAQGGIPVTSQIRGGRIAFVKMEHVWLEAWVDF
ncbi:MAG: transglutaminase domain-containing protein, partial [Gammaproteobacteria bacterium]|nr:transglutaminase domain-containing protein [Gammaproteobacteria bacterium]